MNRTEKLVQTFTQKIRETYVLLGKTLIPLLKDKPEDIDTLIELGGVFEQLGCMREAVTTYERLRQLDPVRLPKRAQGFLDRHRDLINPETQDARDTHAGPTKGEPT